MNITESLSDNGKALFHECMKKKKVKKNGPVLSKGDAVSGAYIVLEGALRVFTISSQGRQASLYRIEPGETCVLAINSLFNDFLYPAWVEAEEDTTIGILPGSVYRTLFTNEKCIQDITISALSSAISGLMSTIDNNLLHTVEQRMASYLLLQANADRIVRNTQQEIALRVGTTREVVARVIANWSKSKLIKSGRGKIEILKPTAMKQVIGENQA